MKTMRKVGAVVLALCLCLSLCVTAFAASSSDEDVDFTITVKNAADGETYTAYKIFDVTYTYEDESDPADGQYAYTIDSGGPWYSTVAAATDVFTLTQVNDTSTYVVTVNEGVEDDAIIAVFVYAGVPEGAVAAVSVEASNGSAVLNVSDPGYYYVTTTLGSLVIIDTTNPAVEIEDKNGQPTVQKYVHDNADPDDVRGKEDDADNDSEVLFEIEISNINGAENLVLHDSMDDELTLPTNFSLNSIVLYTSKDATGIELTTASYDETTETWGNGDYYITIGDCTVEDSCTLDDCAFEIHFLRSFDDVDATGSIVLTYYLHLDTEGDAYDEDYEQIENFAQVTFGTTSASEEVVAETYSFGFEIYKYTGSLIASNYSEVITAEFSNDNPDNATWQDELYLMLLVEDSTSSTGYSEAYYATFEAIEGYEYTYVITGWVTVEGEASFIYEPENGDSGVYTATFYVTESVGIPTHDLIHLDEDASNASQETNTGVEVISASEYGEALANAEFQVTNTAGLTAYFLYEDGLGIYLLEGWTDDVDNVDGRYTTTITSASDGMIYVEGFDTGTYTVTEIKAPDGYNLLTSSIEVTLTATYDDETGLLSEYTVTWTIGETTGEGVVNVENNSGTLLPGTGGMGTTIFYVIGAILICGAAVVLITRRRMNHAA